jgi:C4-dicarboxylate transporter DctM subunit
MLTLYLFIGLLVLLTVGVPVSVAMLLAAAAGLILYDYSLEMIAQRLFSQTDSFPLLAIPLFVFAGGIMSRGGMSRRLIVLASSVVGNLRGGLAMVSILACMFFSSISGSTAATTAAIGMVLIPAVAKTGFSKGAATGLLATAGSLGIIIPPSIPFILLGVVGGISIGKLFIGGILPGILAGVLLMLTSWLIACIQKHPASGQPFHLSGVLKALLHSLLPLLTVVFIVGSIVLGIATPTESAVIAVAWALLVCGGFYRELQLGDMPEIMINTVKITGIVVFCIGATAPFAWLLTIEQIPAQIAETMLSISSDPAILKLLMLVIFLGLGTFLDLTPAVIILTPILFPIARHIGMDPVHFGVVMVFALAIGQSTPPVGISLFVACSVAKTRIGQVALPLIPFLLAMILALILITFIPFLSTGLAGLMR